MPADILKYMPTPAKRIQVQLRAQVLDTVESISAEKGLSLSKVVSLLLEEALAHRGMYGDSGANPPAARSGAPDRSAPSSAKADFDALLQEHSVQTVKNTRGRKITAQRMPELEGEGMDDADEMLRKIRVLQAAGIL